MATISTVLEDYEVKTLENLRDRLYTENRMDGDTMRNFAQALDAILRSIRVYAEEL